MNTMITVYNMLAISYVNRDMDAEGLGCLGKALELYRRVIESGNQDNVYHNRADEPKGRKFHCYYQGGLNLE